MRQGVREAYAKVAKANDAGQGTPDAASCCGVSDDAGINTLISSRLGYTEVDMGLVPSGADLVAGCMGNAALIEDLE